MINRAWLLSRVYRIGYQPARVYWFLAGSTKNGVKCVITRGDDVLMVRHTYGDRRAWELPGGSIKRGEDPIDTARRETLEEVGLSIAGWDALGDFFASYTHRADTMYCFHAVVDDVCPVPDGAEIAEARWFPLSAPPTHTGKYVRRILSMSEASAARAG